jgi:hypothetical protein
MATIIQGAVWTLTENAANLMESKGLIVRCEAEHGLLEVDKPVFHKHIKAPDWFGFSTVSGAINDAEKEVENDSATK